MALSDDPGAAGVKPSGRRSVAVKTIRLRDKEHCKFVAFQPCVVCGRTPSEAHHIRFAQPRARPQGSATNTKFQSAGSTTGSYTVTATKPHGGPVAVSIDPMPIALELWRRTRVAESPVSAEEQ